MKTNHRIHLCLAKTGICLPSGPRVRDEDVKYIVETIKSLINC
jgi:dTDP-4-amino-4,6-dideoxygalactose transaminase